MVTVENIELKCDELPRTAGNFSGILLILGSGASVFEDVNNAKAIVGEAAFEVMAANLSFLAYNGAIRHLVSLHQDRIGLFHSLAKILPEDRHAHIHTHTHMKTEDAENAWPITIQDGTTSLFCVKIAILLGYKKIILCGVPLEGSHRFYDNPHQEYINNFGCPAIAMPWLQAKIEIFNDRVRSMSGKSKELLGSPTKEWTNGLES